MSFDQASRAVWRMHDQNDKIGPVSACCHGSSYPMDQLTRSFMEARDDVVRFLKRRGRQRAAEDYRSSPDILTRARSR